MPETAEPLSDDTDDSLRGNRQRAIIRTEVIQNLVEHCPELTSLNAVRVQVRYGSGGDEGSIAELLALDAANQAIALPFALYNDIAAGVYDLLQSGDVQGCESYGVLTLDVAKQNVRLDHNHTVTTTQNQVIVYDPKPIGGVGVESTAPTGPRSDSETPS